MGPDDISTIGKTAAALSAVSGLGAVLYKGTSAFFKRKAMVDGFNQRVDNLEASNKVEFEKGAKRFDSLEAHVIRTEQKIDSLLIDAALRNQND